MSSDLTFITNEPGKSLRDRFGVLLGTDTLGKHGVQSAGNVGSFNLGI
ncbi:MAG: hypothetical protein ABSA97_09135 [Verrucomicrobiia bacterium]|jgi:hypothetical protein